MANPAPLLIDAHAHVFARSLALAPGRRYAPETDALLEDYLGHLDAHGLRAGVLIQPSFLGTDNGYMLDAIRQAPNRLRGVAVVDQHAAPDELERLARGGVVGIRLNLIGQPLPVLDRGGWPRLLACLRALDWHVEVHVEAVRLATIVGPLRAAQCRVVVDHFGRPAPATGAADPGFQWLLEAARDDGVWVKLSGAYRNWSEPDGPAACQAARLLVEHAGPERLVWGSDWPHTQHPGVTYAQTYQALANWIDDIDLRLRILAANPSRCFAF
ncbi:amidohydrolase family protein [Pigmentiphaga sp. GD03639]|uniref:amidohydrolase family protein n=1 Tax=unclassified Pigmentiphaga TaxID=2626614 RepID=UPI001052AE51|nr:MULTISPECIES: amidohydrolase family protein [unclassified Pigmentiphaga]MDH2239997.1 amidohydrolase family protein [Pigmentiphaga sp. GD03639]